MKKTFLLVFFLTLCLGSFAKKSYVNIYAVGSNGLTPYSFYLSGDIPTGIYTSYSNDIKIGNLLNKLSEHGFEVESISSIGLHNSKSDASVKCAMCYLLSKSSDDTSNPNAIPTIKADDSEVYEVARYNLQGLPVKENVKGVQIVVFSNYTTKTIIVE